MPQQSPEFDVEFHKAKYLINEMKSPAFLGM
jgi:hypothetical protein